MTLSMTKMLMFLKHICISIANHDFVHLKDPTVSYTHTSSVKYDFVHFKDPKASKTYIFRAESTPV